MAVPPDPDRGPRRDDETQRVEAARYALLRRLAPSLRHEVVAYLQPVTMIGGVLERRLAAPQPEPAPLREGVTRLVASSRAAVQSSLDLVAWLAPDPGTRPLHEVVDEVVTLLRGSLGFRGFTLMDETAGLACAVPCAGLRCVLPASLLWLTDSAGPPAQVTLRAQAAAGQVRLALSLAPLEGAAGSDTPPAYRPLSLEDVQALARAEGIALDAAGDSLALRLPCAD